MTDQGTTSGKAARLGTAAGFLSGVITCLDAVHDAKSTWPVSELWQALSRPKRLELCAGIVLILVTFVISIVRKPRLD